MWWEAPHRVALSRDKRLRTYQVSNRLKVKSRSSEEATISVHLVLLVAVHYMYDTTPPHARLTCRIWSMLCSFRIGALLSASDRFFAAISSLRVATCIGAGLYAAHRNYLMLSVYGIERLFIRSLRACVNLLAVCDQPVHWPIRR